MSLIYIDFTYFLKLNTIYNLKIEKKALSNQKTLCHKISPKFTKNLSITLKNFGKMPQMISFGLKNQQKF